MPETDDFPLIPHLLLTDEEVTNQMISLYREKYEDGTSPIRDFFEGSQIRNILASTSIEGSQLRSLINLILKMGYVSYAKAGWLDILGEEYDVLRISAIKSRGFLLFTYPIGEEDNEDPSLYEPITIPAFTYVAPSKSSYLEYETLEDVVIHPGSSVTVPAQSVQGGIQGDIGARKIDSIIDDNEELWDLEVINPLAFIGGEEEEDDESYRERIKNRQKEIEKWGTLDWYEARAEEIEGVHDATIVNQPVGRYTVGLIINGIIKPTSDELVNQVRDWFYQRKSLIGGMDILVKKVDERPVNYQITGTVAKGQNPELVRETIKNDLKCLLEGGTTSTGIKYDGFNSGEKLYMTQNYAVLMALKNILPSWYITIPNIDIIPRSDEVLIFGEVNFLL